MSDIDKTLHFKQFLSQPQERDIEISPEYKEKVVAFVDILGMSEFMRQIDKKESDAPKKYRSINSVSEIFASIFRDDNKQFSKMEISDSFVISTSIDLLSDLIDKLAVLQLQLLLDTDFLIRGAIAYAEVIDHIEKIG